MKARSVDIAWDAIFSKYEIAKHNFDATPYEITSGQIKTACQDFTATGAKEVRILCKQDTREKRPIVFQEMGLFLLPVKNGVYKIIKGEGYIDISKITSSVEHYNSDFDFILESSRVGNSEMQHLDYAYAVSLIRNFMQDDSLVLTIRGRKYTPAFNFKVGKFLIDAESVQTEVDSGYEGRSKIVLVEAKNARTTNTIIRQLYYPYRQWQLFTKKDVFILFFEKRKSKNRNMYNLWEFIFTDKNDYSSIKLARSKCYTISTKVEQ